MVSQEQKYSEGHRGDRHRYNNYSLPAGVRIVAHERGTVAFTELIRIRKSGVAFGTMLHIENTAWRLAGSERMSQFPNWQLTSLNGK